MNHIGALCSAAVTGRLEILKCQIIKNASSSKLYLMIVVLMTEFVTYCLILLLYPTIVLELSFLHNFCQIGKEEMVSATLQDQEENYHLRG
jgi:hypothetical protein